jgi:hypothetical protein
MFLLKDIVLIGAAITLIHITLFYIIINKVISTASINIITLPKGNVRKDIVIIACTNLALMLMML